MEGKLQEEFLSSGFQDGMEFLIFKVEQQQQENDHLRDMLKRARNHSRDRRKEVKVLHHANRKHKQEIERLKYWETDGNREIAWHKNKSKALEQELEQVKKDYQELADATII